MKCIHFVLATLLIVPGGCSTHFYSFKVDNVTIYLRKPKAHTVLFACSLDGYKFQPLNQHNRFWEVKLPSDSSFKYFYLVDDEIFTPPCPLQENDDFGSKNCVFEPKL